MKRTIMMMALLSCIAMFDLMAQADSVNHMHEYRFEVYASGGPQVSWFRERRTPYTVGGGALGTNLTFRAMWHPDHLLSVGLLSGWTSFSTEKLDGTNAKGETRSLDAQLTAVPLQIAFGMQKWGFEVGVGIGAYVLFSDLDQDMAAAATSSTIESGVSALFAYTFDVTNRLGIGPEVNVHALSYRGITSASAQLRLRYALFVY